MVVFDWLRRFLCGLQGHDLLLRFERDRLYMQCTSCGHESPGWELNEAPPTPRLHGVASHHALVHAPQLVDARRVA